MAAKIVEAFGFRVRPSNARALLVSLTISRQPPPYGVHTLWLRDVERPKRFRAYLSGRVEGTRGPFVSDLLFPAPPSRFQRRNVMPRTIRCCAPVNGSRQIIRGLVTQRWSLGTDCSAKSNRPICVSLFWRWLGLPYLCCTVAPNYSFQRTR